MRSGSFSSARTDAAQARIAQLLGNPAPRRRISMGLVATSLVGMVLATTLMMCVAQSP